MMRKAMIAVAAAGSMMMGFGAVATPADAKVVIVIGGHPHHHFARWHCHYKTVKVWNKKKHKWVRVKRKTYCHRAWH